MPARPFPYSRTWDTADETRTAHRTGERVQVRYSPSAYDSLMGVVVDIRVRVTEGAYRDTYYTVRFEDDAQRVFLGHRIWNLECDRRPIFRPLCPHCRICETHLTGACCQPSACTDLKSYRELMGRLSTPLRALVSKATFTPAPKPILPA